MKTTVYLDHAATTPIRDEVREAMLPFLGGDRYGNPSSAHRFGRDARAAVEQARAQVAAAMGVDPTEVFFTSGGTEADNLAVVGGALAARERGRPFAVAVSALEHPAVTAAARAVERLGGRVTVLPVDRHGQVGAPGLQRVLDEGVGLLSAMWVNNEIGIVQDVPALAAACAERNVAFHTDGVQAVGKVPCTLADLPIPLFSLSGHKIGAPQGIGALIVRERDAVEALQYGGGQQSGVRPGTENTPGIVGLGRAVQLAVQEQGSFASGVARLRERLERELAARVPDLVVNGDRAPRAPHVCNVSVPGADADALTMHLDLAGIACSTGSACQSGTSTPSEGLLALGVDPDLARRAIRFSLSRQTTDAEIDRVLDVLPGIVARVRAAVADPVGG